jgi:tetratricopeptide (TPR) repeat protein
MQHIGMKKFRRERKPALRPSRKGRVHPAHLPGRSGSARFARAAHARLRSGPSGHSLAAAEGQAGSSRTAEYLTSEARFRRAVKNFELGARAFQNQDYENAQEIFEKLASTGVAGVAERARVYLRLCERKLSHPTPPPRKAEDLYTLGVGALNSGQLSDAIEYLNKAQKLGPNVEHIRYALAAAYSLRGDAENALQHLKEAIALRPENRIQARRDEDFQALATDARFKELVFTSNP